MAGRKRRSSSGLILIDCAVCRSLTRAECWHTQPHKKVLSLVLNQNIHKVSSMKTAGGCPMMMALSWWLSSSGVWNKQTSVFVHLGRLPTFRERTLHWSQARWNWVFCPSYQVFSLHPPHQGVLRPFSCSCFLPHPIESIPLLFCLTCIVQPLLTGQPFFVCPSPTRVPDTLSWLIKIH